MKIKVIIEKGETKVEISGIKGKGCMDFVEIEKKLGEVKRLKKTKEYYEKEEVKTKRRVER